MIKNKIAYTKSYLDIKTGTVADNFLIDGHINPLMLLLNDSIERLSDNIVTTIINDNVMIIFENTGNYVSMPIYTYSIAVNKIEIDKDRHKNDKLIIKTTAIFGVDWLEIKEDCSLKLKMNKCRDRSIVTNNISKLIRLIEKIIRGLMMLLILAVLAVLMYVR